MSQVQQVDKLNQIEQLNLGLIHIASFQSSTDDLTPDNCLLTMKILNEKKTNLQCEGFSPSEDHTDTLVKIIHFENALQDNLTGENGGHFAEVVKRLFDQHLNWLEKYVN